jgi:hypothetical protein
MRREMRDGNGFQLVGISHIKMKFWLLVVDIYIQSDLAVNIYPPCKLSFGFKHLLVIK